MDSTLVTGGAWEPVSCGVLKSSNSRMIIEEETKALGQMLLCECLESLDTSVT
jgi:hypothetical protein